MLLNTCGYEPVAAGGRRDGFFYEVIPDVNIHTCDGVTLKTEIHFMPLGVAVG